MIPPQAGAKADAGSRETDRAGTCAGDVGSWICLKGALLEQDRLQDKELCKSSVAREE